jgi:hypothetical protein
MLKDGVSVIKAAGFYGNDWTLKADIQEFHAGK